MRFCIRLSGPIFRVKLNLHIYKMVKDFKTSSLTNVAAANVCTMKKTRGLYHVPERRYFNFSPGRFSEIVAILTAPAVYYISPPFSSHLNPAVQSDLALLGLAEDGGLLPLALSELGRRSRKYRLKRQVIQAVHLPHLRLYPKDRHMIIQYF